MRCCEQRKDVDELKEAFKVFDKDGDGTITSKVCWLLLSSVFFAFASRYDEIVSPRKHVTLFAQEIEAVMRALGEKVDSETLDLMIKSVDSVRLSFSCYCCSVWCRSHCELLRCRTGMVPLISTVTLVGFALACFPFVPSVPARVCGLCFALLLRASFFICCVCGTEFKKMMQDGPVTI